MKNVRYGIIGLGNQGSSYLLNIFEGGFAKNACVSAVCDINPDKIEAIKAKTTNEGLVYFTDYIEMLDSGLCDAVLVETPHYDHPKMVIECLKRGIHVICDKPAGVYAKQVREMNEVAEMSGAKFGMMFNQRTNCIYRKMKEIVASGELGAIKRTNWIITDWYRPNAYYASGDWRATWSGEGGGVLLNQCPHNLDLWQWICGMPKTVEAKLHFGKWHDIEVEDDVSAYVEYENGATGIFVTTTGDAPGTNRFEITLEKGKIVADKKTLKIWKSEENMTEAEFSATNTSPFGHMKFTEMDVETDGENLQHVGVFNAFAAHILHGTPLVADGREGINGLTISNAMHLSAWTGKAIDIATFDHALYKEELMKRVATSRRKTVTTNAVAADMSDTF